MNQNTQQGSISSSDLIDAKLEEHKLCGSKHCPGCGHKLKTKPDWVGLPAGVKFDPTDQELIEHLEAKVEAKEFKSHPLIDEFIPTIEGEDGICYTHPEKLPGVTRDGLSKHFFHRPSKAYTTGTRKRRKIQTETDLQAGGDTRWHKTGKTRPVMLNGKQKGCKKILVLYTNFGKNRKPEKTNWVMHQYHLGQHEEEKEGELVVSKIFYQTQPRQSLNAAVSASGEANSDLNKRSEASGSGSCSSSKEIFTQTDDFSGAALNICAPIPSYTVALDHHIQQQMKVDSFAGYLPFVKTFHEAALMENVGEASSNINAGGTCQAPDQMMGHEDHHHHQQQQQQHQMAYHINRPSYSISNVVSPSTMHNHSSMIIDEADHSFLVPKVMQLPNPHLQQEQHHKVEGRSASGLEELIMGCTSSTHADTTKQESSSMVANNPQHEAEWLKYSTFWSDPDHNPDHHG